jgi:hypoxanthine-DNA glycosylase
MARSAASQGFAPVIDGGARVLVLGSLPGQRSLREQQYYAHPRNVFWRLMGEMLGFDAAESYTERCNRLKNRGIALWDVLQSSRRPGSLDSAIDISSARANDFSSLLKHHQDIKLICFNGKKSQDLFERLVLKDVAAVQEIKLVSLPSSSPAHAAMRYEDKLTRWLIIGQYTDLTGSQPN